MQKKSLSIILVGLLTLILPLTTLAQSDGIALQKDVYLGEPILGPEDLPDEVTFNLYDSETALTPIGTQTFPKGEYTVDFEFSKSDGLTSGNVARVNAKFTNKLNLKDDPDSSAQVKELWVDVAVDGTEIAGRTKVSDEALVQLLLASDASIATYLTLVYEGDDNPITTIYKDLPLSSLASDSSGFSLSNYFSTLTGNLSDRALTDPNNWYPTAGGDICYLQGYVGIGTSVPTAHLDIRSDRAVLKMDATKGTFDYPRIKGYADRPNSGQGVGSFEWWNNGATPVGGIYIDRGTSDTTGEMSFWTSNNPRMRINQAGNVGIGTTTPAYLLDVDGEVRFGDRIRFGSAESFYDGGANLITTDQGLSVGRDLTVGDDIRVNDDLWVDSRIGVGTTSPSAGLHIKGATWPDSFAYFDTTADNEDAGMRFYENGTFRGHLYHDASEDLLRLESGSAWLTLETLTGHIGINTDAPGAALHIKQSGTNSNDGLRLQTSEATGEDWYIFMDADDDLNLRNDTINLLTIMKDTGEVGIGDESPDFKLEVNGTAGKPGGGSWSNSSDARLKDITGEYDRGLDAVLSLRPVTFRYKEGNPRDLPIEEEYVGFVAQEVQDMFPEAVSEGKDGYLDFNMHSINVALVNAVKELKAENEALKQEIEQIKAALGL